MREPNTTWRGLIQRYLEPEVWLGIALFAPVAAFLIYTRPDEMAFILVNNKFHAAFTLLAGVTALLAWKRGVDE